jgi:hypothetical protein
MSSSSGIIGPFWLVACGAREVEHLTTCYPILALPCHVPYPVTHRSSPRNRREAWRNILCPQSLSETERRWGKRQGGLNLHCPRLRRDGGVYDWRDTQKRLFCFTVLLSTAIVTCCFLTSSHERLVGKTGSLIARGGLLGRILLS